MIVSAAVATHVGLVRQSNQDRSIVDPALGLFAVFDGMGGHAAGDVAATIARDELLRWIREYTELQATPFDPRELLHYAIDTAAKAVHIVGKRELEHQGMGTTVVACLRAGADKLIVGHVGDSRAYLLRDGCLQPMTRDHTVVQELLAQGKITSEIAPFWPQGNLLSRNLGQRRGASPDFTEVELEPGDKLLLCSDGLHGAISEESIAAILGTDDDPQEITRRLILEVLKGDAQDNITVVVLVATSDKEGTP